MLPPPPKGEAVTFVVGVPNGDAVVDAGFKFDETDGVLPPRLKDN